ncbi:HD domain-containing protein [Candidatus Micrarchaeota archaeon]|jgi:putative hydrolase of HD superfamily|nr:HD domain-containing protein [Candidatus Micrarchaeota archaeon]
MNKIERIINLGRFSGQLKNIVRKGWLKYPIKYPESNADHSFRVAFLSMVLAEELNLDVDKCAKLAILHEFGEIEKGDLTPEERKNENKIIEDQSKILKQMMIEMGGQKYYDLWMESEKTTSKEAVLVKDVDRLEMCLQALEYEEKYEYNLQEFYDYAEKLLILELPKQIFKKILKLRPKNLKKINPKYLQKGKIIFSEMDLID